MARLDHVRDATAARFQFLAGMAWEPDHRGREVVAADRLRSLAERAGEAVTQLAGAAVRSPVFEGKVAAAFACYEVAEVYRDLNQRLVELRMKPVPRHGIDPVGTDAIAWMPLPEIETRMLQPMIAELQALIGGTNRMADWPTVRTLERQCRPNLEAARSIIVALTTSGREGLSEISQMAARDNRYATFNDTRDYRRQAPAGDRDDVLESLLAQIRTQRDELDAVETFARVLAADGHLAPAELVGLARVVVDEARHSVIGEIGLEMLGFDPFAIPVGTIGAELRRGLDPWDGLAQICLIGESGNLRDLGQSAARAHNQSHHDLAEMLRTIHQDEFFHLAFGIQLLVQRHPHSSPAELQTRALQLTNQFLEDRGIGPVTVPEAARLFGE
jgi:hypothetical protein